MPAKQDKDSADPTPPGEGQDALWHTGTEPVTAEGITFAPDSVQNVPSEVAARLAGKQGIKLVMESVESWPHFLAMRARHRNG